MTYIKGLSKHLSRGIEVDHMCGFQAVLNLGFHVWEVGVLSTESSYLLSLS